MYKSKIDYSDSEDSNNDYSSEKKRSRRFSRSRSPVQSYKQMEFQRKRSKMVDLNEELYNKKLELLDEKKKFSSDIKDIKKSIETIKAALDGYKSNALIFLPCSHHKIVNVKYKQLLDITFEKALEKLSENEMKNEIILRQLRSKIFYNIEAKHPEVFKCIQSEKYTHENCGHKMIAECHEIKKFMKNSIIPNCTARIDYIFDCGHAESTECHLTSNSRCSRCS